MIDDGLLLFFYFSSSNGASYTSITHNITVCIVKACKIHHDTILIGLVELHSAPFGRSAIVGACGEAEQHGF